MYPSCSVDARIIQVNLYGIVVSMKYFQIIVKPIALPRDRFLVSALPSCVSGKTPSLLSLSFFICKIGQFSSKSSSEK